jgi:transposase-like protein
MEDGIDETLTYYDFPSEHWVKIRTNNAIKRLNREIRCRDQGDGSLPGRRLRPHAGLRPSAPCGWNPVGNKKHMNMKHFAATLEVASIAG